MLGLVYILTTKTHTNNHNTNLWNLNYIHKQYLLQNPNGYIHKRYTLAAKRKVQVVDFQSKHMSNRRKLYACRVYDQTMRTMLHVCLVVILRGERR